MPEFDAIVIGSGMGGLTTAVILARMKRWRVLVLERHFRAGGFTHIFKRPGGYQWDVGLHYVGEMEEGSLGRKLFGFVTGGAVRWNPMPANYDRFLYPGIQFDVPKGEANFRHALTVQFPSEAVAIGQYFRDIRKAASYATRAIIAGSMPAVASAFIKLLNRFNSRLPLTTTREYMNSHCQDPLLKALLASQWMDYGLPPSRSAFVTHALIVHHYLNGAWYPEGGSGVIAEHAQRIIESAGGKVCVNHEVEKVIVENGRAAGVEVRLQSKGATSLVRFDAPVVISDTGAWSTFQKLLPPSINIPFRAELDELVSAEHPGFTNVTLYLALNRDPRTLGFQGENHWIFESLDHEAMVANQNDLLEGHAHGCYLSFPSLKDPNAKQHTAEIIAPLSYASVEMFRSEPWRRRSEPYQQIKDNMSKAMLDLVERRYPGFSDMVAFSELSTPLSVDHFTAHPHGAIYGVPATPERYRKSWLKPDTPVKGLYLTGTDAGTLGIMGAMMGGVSAAARIIGPFGLFSIVAAATRSQYRKVI